MEIPSAGDLAPVLERIRGTITHPYPLPNTQGVRIELSMGIVLYPEGGKGS
jgi:GGDEF domain-containing protein